MNFFKSILSIQWGAKSLVALYLSVFSGIAVSLHYDPAAPYYSASSLDILVPFGDFWRSLHFYASQLFVLFLVVHLLVVIVEGEFKSLTPRRWTLLILASAVSILLLFTGYVLRDDATGKAAGAIAENIMLSIPILGTAVNSLIFSMSEVGMGRVYANHMVGLCVLWIFLSWEHLRRYTVNWRNHPWLVILVILFCAFVKAPMEPDQVGVFHISGPWFFMGLQEILRYIPPFWAGIIWPGLLIIALIFLYPQYNLKKPLLIFIGFWFLLYLVFSLIALKNILSLT
nr:cytochrome b N-terminal domain-containing protein [Desulfobulbaceae bacterium]